MTQKEHQNVQQVLKWVVSILQEKKIPFQVTGGFAAHVYGATRDINDIDIDIPEDRMSELLPDVQPYVIYGPIHFKEDKWDVHLLTLNYHGQEIDIGGAYDTRIFDEHKQEWIHSPADLDTAEMHEVDGVSIPVVAPQALIDYKRLLSGEHQQEDIKAVQRYIDEHGS